MLKVLPLDILDVLYLYCFVFVFSEYRKIDNDEEVEGAVPD